VDDPAPSSLGTTWHLGERFVISSSGGLLRGVSIDNLLPATPRSRNHVLFHAHKRIGLAKRRRRAEITSESNFWNQGLWRPRVSRTVHG
jgi:hypothetical protein